MTAAQASHPRRITIPGFPALELGLLLAFTAAVISGFSIWVNTYAVREVSDPAVFATAKNVLVGACFLGLLLGSRRPIGRSRSRRIERRQVPTLLLLGALGGSIPFVLFFEGLASAGAGNGAFIQKSLFIWVAMLAVPLLGERLSVWQLFALAMLAVSQWLIGHPGAFEFGRGEAMVLAATLLWAGEVIVARRLLPSVGPAIGATARMGIGGLLLLAYLAATGKLDDFVNLNSLQLRWVLVTAVLLACYVGAWYGALRLAPATVVTSILALGAPITALLSTVGSGRPAPHGEQLAGFALLAAAAIVLALATARPLPQRRSPQEPA